MKVILVPHTHWDREWYASFAAFQGRLVDMMDSLLDLLAREPRFRHFHLDGQTVLVDDYLALRPEREPELEAFVRAGRLSFGPWFTQADEFLVSGETTIRNLEWGLARARALGLNAPVSGPWAGYLPDQFGHIGQMPQILRSMGIERAVVIRGVPARIDRSPFRWRSPDGSEVLAENLVDGYYVGADLDTAATSAGELAAELQRVIAQVAATAGRDTILVPVGGDHMGPLEGIVELLDEASALTDHEVSIGSLAGFLAQTDAPADAATWTGELRAASHSPLLPNVYSTRPHQKRRRAQLEARLERYAEPLAALVPGFTWPATALDEAWRLLLLNATHDSAYGASHDQVARDVDARFAEAEALTETAIAEAAALLAAGARDAGILRWNPSPFVREGIPGLGWTVVSGDGASALVACPVPFEVDGDLLVLDDGMVISFTDEDDAGDLFTFCPPDGGSPMSPTSVAETGPGRAEVRFPGTTIELAVTRRHGEPFVRIDGRIDNARPDHRLVLWVDVGSTPAGSTALAPFEVVKRPLAGEGYADEVGSATWPARGAVLAGDTALLAEGVVEYEVRGSRLGVMLLRAVGLISRPAVATRPVYAGPATPTPDAQALGTTAFSLGVVRGAREDGLVEAWERFALPVLEAAAPGDGATAVGTLLEISGACLSSVRRVGDAVEVRAWNDLPSPRSARIGGREVPLGPAEIRTVRLD